MRGTGPPRLASGVLRDPYRVLRDPQIHNLNSGCKLLLHTRIWSTYNVLRDPYRVRRIHCAIRRIRFAMLREGCPSPMAWRLYTFVEIQDQVDVAR